MRPNLKLTAFATLAAFALVTGCGAQPEARMPGAPGTPSQPGTPDNPGEPIPQNPPAPTAKFAGVYQVVAPIDLTQDGVLPGVLGPMLGALIELHDHPGKALLDIVANANIPTVSDAVKGLPSVVRDVLSNLLDKLIVDQVYGNVPVVEQITNIISGITELAKTIDIHNTLTVHTPAADGSAKVEQQVTDVGFKLLNKQTVVAFDADEKKAAFSAMPGTITPHANAPVADADLTLAGGQMTLPFGQLMLQAAGPLIFSQFGGATDLKGALNNLVPCHDAAQAISDALDGYLSAALVEQICVAAVGAVADTVTNQIDQIQLKDVQVTDAKAFLLDVSQAKPQTDYQADRIADGKWTWSFSLAGSTIKVPSTLAGDRVGDAQ